MWTPRSRTGVLLAHACDHVLLHRRREVPALVDLAVEGDGLDEALQVLEGRRGDRVLAGRHLFGVGVLRRSSGSRSRCRGRGGCGWLFAWMERKRSAPLELAMPVRSSRGMKTSVDRVITTSAPSSAGPACPGGGRRRARGPSPAGRCGRWCRGRARRGRHRSRCAGRRGRAVGRGCRSRRGSGAGGSGGGVGEGAAARTRGATRGARRGEGSPAAGAGRGTAGRRSDARRSAMGDGARAAAAAEALGGARAGHHAGARARRRDEGTATGSDAGPARRSAGTAGGLAGRRGRGRWPLHVDDEARRVLEVEDLVLPHVLEVEDDPDDVVAVLRDPDLLQQPVAHREARGRARFGWSRVPTRSIQSRSGSRDTSDCSCTFRSTSITTRVEDSPLQERRSKTRARPGGGGDGSGVAGARLPQELP